MDFESTHFYFSYLILYQEKTFNGARHVSDVRFRAYKSIMV